MKKSMMFVTVVFVAMMAFVGCANPVIPTPDPVVPDPVKLAYSNVAYKAISGTDDIAANTMYRWDNDANGTPDTGIFVEINGVEKTVTLDNTEWTITVGTAKYLNTARMTGESWAWNTYTLTFIRDGSNNIVGHATDGGTSTVDYQYATDWGTWTYNANGSISFNLSGPQIWTKN